MSALYGQAYQVRLLEEVMAANATLPHPLPLVRRNYVWGRTHFDPTLEVELGGREALSISATGGALAATFESWDASGGLSVEREVAFGCTPRLTLLFAHLAATEHATAEARMEAQAAGLVGPQGQTVFRHGQRMYRLLSVEPFENESETGLPLHRVEAVAVATGQPAWWHATTTEALQRGWLTHEQVAAGAEEAAPDHHAMRAGEQEPCCYGFVTSGGQVHEPGCHHEGRQ